VGKAYTVLFTFLRVKNNKKKKPEGSFISHIARFTLPERRQRVQA
jgi:hypothetical protein